jgi:hypothetical protein
MSSIIKLHDSQKDIFLDIMYVNLFFIQFDLILKEVKIIKTGDVR